MPFPADQVRFGANLAPHPDPAEQFALPEGVEALGFDSLWCGDHILFNIPLYESLTLLSFYAAHTKRIRVGTCVYLLALRHPTVVAKITATLDALSGGRLIFRVGGGGGAAGDPGAGGVPGAVRQVRGGEHRPETRSARRPTHLDRRALGCGAPAGRPPRRRLGL